MNCGVRIGLLLALVAGVLGGCGEKEESDRIFDRADFPFTFEYPEGFEERDDVTVDTRLGNDADATAAVAIDTNDGLFPQLYTLNVAVDESRLGLAKREFDRLIRGVEPTAEFAKGELAGLPALTAEDVPIGSIEDAASDLTVVFDGDQEYLINCQSTPEHRDEVEAACSMALETFAVKR